VKHQPLAAMASFNSLTPSILFVGQSTLLLTNISSFSLTWRNNSITTHKGCIHCEITLPCATIFNSTAGSYIHQITKCTGIHDRPTVSHLLNLAFLSKFFNEDTLEHFTANTKLQEELNVRLPNLPIFESNYTQDLADLSVNTLQLDKVANLTQEKAQIFRDTAHKMLHDIQTGNLFVKTSFLDYSAYNIMLFCTTAATILALVMAIILFRKVRGLAAAIALLQHPTNTQAAAMTPPHLLDFFIHENPTTTIAPTMLQWESTITATDMLWSLIVLFTTLILLYRWYKKSHPPLFVARLYLEIGNKQHQAIIPLMTLYHPTEYCTFNLNTYMHSLKVSGYFTPILHTQCPTFTTHNSFTQLTHTIPQAITLGPLQAIKIRRILKGEYYSTIYTFENGKITPVIARDVSPTSVSINTCLLYTSPSPRDRQKSRMPSSA